MNYQTYEPHPDLKSFINCYWTLEVPKQANTQKQCIVPDGYIEMVFILGDDVRRYISEDEFIIQPRTMVLWQTTKPFYVEPTGYVNTFAIRFYPFGFANFISKPIQNLANKETSLKELFWAGTANKLGKEIINAKSTEQRINIIDTFLLESLNNEEIMNRIVKNTLDTLFSSKWKNSITSIFQNKPSKRRQFERNFKKQVGMSPKRLGKLIRLQTALKMLLSKNPESLTHIAYKSQYFDQSHFIKDFKEFTGVKPKEFLNHEGMKLSSLFYE